MAKIDWTRWQTVLLCLTLVAALVIVLGIALAQIAHTLLLFAIAFVVALILAPFVEWGQAHRMPRWLAVVATYLTCGLIVVVGALLMITPSLNQLRDLAAALPGYVASLQATVAQAAQNLENSPVAGALVFIRLQVLGAVDAWAAQLISMVASGLSALGSFATDAILVLIISIYMLVGGRRIRNSIHGALPARQAPHFLFVADAATRVMGAYIRGQVLLALLLGAAVTVGLFLLGMPYALLLGLLAMMLGVIPMLGSALSAVPALLVALTQPPPMVLWVLIFFVVVQNVQDQVLAPRIQGQSVGLHPLAVLFFILAGAQLWGAVGAMFVLPAAAFIWIIVVAIYRSRQLHAADALVAEPVVAAGGSTSAAGPEQPAALLHTPVSESTGVTESVPGGTHAAVPSGTDPRPIDLLR